MTKIFGLEEIKAGLEKIDPISTGFFLKKG